MKISDFIANRDTCFAKRPHHSSPRQFTKHGDWWAVVDTDGDWNVLDALADDWEIVDIDASPGESYLDGKP